MAIQYEPGVLKAASFFICELPLLQQVQHIGLQLLSNLSTNQGLCRYGNPGGENMAVTSCTA